MRCEIKGHENILYVCQSPNCDYMPLCKICKNNHNPEHSSYLIRYQIALEKALKNLDSQIQKLQQYIAPIQKKKQTLWAVSKQIDALKQDKRKLVRKIQDQIDKQIKALQSKNGGVQEQQQKFYDELKKKMQSLEEMKNNAERQAKVLRNSLTMEIQNYLYYMGKNNPYFTSRNQAQQGDLNIAQLYVKTEHEMILSQLELRKEILNPKLLKKMNNESPLYFLIDPKYETGKYLHYFIPQEKSLQLRVYDVERQKWTKHINRDYKNFTFTSQFCSVFDHQFNRFYYICGKKSRPSNEIIWFDVQKNFWGKSTLRKPRHSAMATLVCKTLKNSEALNSCNYLLVAGGFDSDGKAMKSWELFDPEQDKTVYEGEMNFASASGKLITFNGDVVFKIGGFANKSPNELGICPIVQRCDFSSLNSVNPKDKFDFTYIEVEDLSRQNELRVGQKKYQLYYAGQGGIQINPNEILIYGGKRGNGQAVDETYILNIQRFQVENYEKKRVWSNRYYARWINEKPLISGMGFEEFSPCIWKGKMFSLQNLPSRYDEVYKGLVEFDMKSWYETENIVDDKL